MEEKQVDILVRKFYAVADLAHITHVNTRSFAAHEALGDFYETVISHKDRLIEYLMGEGRLLKVNANILEIGSDIATEATTLKSMYCGYAKASMDEALINMSGEFEEAVGKLKFLLMLS